MSEAKLPAVRLPTVIAGQSVDDDGYDQDTVVVELPVSNKFGFAWPAEPPASVAPPPIIERAAGLTLSSSEGETDISEDEIKVTVRKPSRDGAMDESEFVTPTNHMNSDENPLDQVSQTPSLPRLSRAFSMPLTSQLGSLQNPRRSGPSPSSPSDTTDLSDSGQLQELSLELADSVQMVIQILLQLSPPQVLDPAKEQFSACSLSIPTPSVSAIFTSMKNLNYMSANMSTLGLDSTIQPSPDLTAEERNASTQLNAQTDFDVGEMLQSVGDALSGVAAQAGVDLVLFHGDVGMKHVGVRGDESGISYTLSHVIRQVVSTARSGDTVEIGLLVEVEEVNGTSTAHAEDTPSILHATSRSSTPVTDGPLRCTFHIAHKFSTSDSVNNNSSVDGDCSKSSSQPRPQPSFKTLILRRLLRHVGASLVSDVPSRGAFDGRSCELSVVLETGSPAVVDPTVDLTPQEAAYLGYPQDFRIAQEPTLEQLNQFVETLRGRKVTLCASAKGAFAQHLTSYLTAWGLDVSHVSPECDEGVPEHSEGDADTSLRDIPTPTLPESSATTPTPASLSSSDGPSFVLIDDNVDELRNRLQRLRAEQAYPLNLQSRKRPSLAANHRPRSSPQVARVLAMTPQITQTPPPVVIVHFTALSNFKLVKDAIQTTISSGGASSRLPEVIVIPKPAGPRRFLTALHTAVTKPVVDPFFAPIATSPISPGIHSLSPFFNFSAPARSPGARSTASNRTASDRSAKSPKETDSISSLTPGSPRGVTDGMEYFSDAAAKLGTSPSSGLVIQSPDGSPAGIFFHPKARTPRSQTSPVSERDQGGSSTPGGRKRGFSFRRSSGEAEESRANRMNSVAAHADAARRLARLAPTVDVAESQDVVQPKVSKGKQRSNADELMSVVVAGGQGLGLGIEPSSIIPEASITTSPTEAPRLVTRKTIPGETLSLQATSPPISPQLRPSGPTSPTKRRGLRRPAADSSASSPSVLQKKGKTTETTIVPPISVLIVDDNPINQTILSTFMKKKSIKFDVAKDGEEAVEKWRTGGFHLILMDIQMPVMDGIDATKEIRRIEKMNATGAFPSTPQSEGQRTPSETSSESRSTTATPPYRSSVIIVALTASSLQSDRVAALAAGCNDFLTKPVSLHWLNNKIIEWGSIKALQMWADIRPDVARSFTSGQAAKAQSVARRLHVPEGRSTPPGLRSRSSSTSHGERSVAEAAAGLMRKERPSVPALHLDEDSPGESSSLSSNVEGTHRVSSDTPAEPDRVTVLIVNSVPEETKDAIAPVQPPGGTGSTNASESPEKRDPVSSEAISGPNGTNSAEGDGSSEHSSTRDSPPQ